MFWLIVGGRRQTTLFSAFLRDPDRRCLKQNNNKKHYEYIAISIKIWFITPPHTAEMSGPLLHSRGEKTQSHLKMLSPNNFLEIHGKEPGHRAPHFISLLGFLQVYVTTCLEILRCWPGFQDDLLFPYKKNQAS